MNKTERKLVERLIDAKHSEVWMEFLSDSLMASTARQYEALLATIRYYNKPSKKRKAKMLWEYARADQSLWASNRLAKEHVGDRDKEGSQNE